MTKSIKNKMKVYKEYINKKKRKAFITPRFSVLCGR